MDEEEYDYHQFNFLGATQQKKGRYFRPMILQEGGGTCIDDFWYDEMEVGQVYQGDTCPVCKKGTMALSKNKKLYCDHFCWDKSEREEIPEFDWRNLE